MKSIQGAHIVVVADSEQGLVLMMRLRRMEVAKVTSATNVDEARGLCRPGGADACIVVVDDTALDVAPRPVCDAPGRASGVPSLLVVPAVTPLVRKAARRNGYLAAIPANLAPRMLYRRLGAALQRRRAERSGRWRPSGHVGVPFLVAAPMFGKPILH